MKLTVKMIDEIAESRKKQTAIIEEALRFTNASQGDTVTYQRKDVQNFLVNALKEIKLEREFTVALIKEINDFEVGFVDSIGAQARFKEYSNKVFNERSK